MTAPGAGRVRWYCHSCGKTHTHTPEQRDAHRDALMQEFARQIDSKNAPASTSSPGGGA